MGCSNGDREIFSIFLSKIEGEQTAIDFFKNCINTQKNFENQEILPTLPDICAPVSTERELVLSLPSIVPELDTSNRSAVISPVILPSTLRCSLFTFP